MVTHIDNWVELGGDEVVLIFGEDNGPAIATFLEGRQDVAHVAAVPSVGVDGTLPPRLKIVDLDRALTMNVRGFAQGNEQSEGSKHCLLAMHLSKALLKCFVKIDKLSPSDGHGTTSLKLPSSVAHLPASVE